MCVGVTIVCVRVCRGVCVWVCIGGAGKAAVCVRDSTCRCAQVVRVQLLGCAGVCSG